MATMNPYASGDVPTRNPYEAIGYRLVSDLTPYASNYTSRSTAPASEAASTVLVGYEGEIMEIKREGSLAGTIRTALADFAEVYPSLRKAEIKDWRFTRLVGGVQATVGESAFASEQANRTYRVKLAPSGIRRTAPLSSQSTTAEPGDDDIVETRNPAFTRALQVASSEPSIYWDSEEENTPLPPARFTLEVRPPSGRSTWFSLKPIMTMGQLSDSFAKREGISPTSFDLVFMGQIVDRARTPLDLNMNIHGDRGEPIHLIYKLCEQRGLPPLHCAPQLSQLFAQAFHNPRSEDGAVSWINRIHMLFKGIKDRAVNGEGDDWSEAASDQD